MLPFLILPACVDVDESLGDLGGGTRLPPGDTDGDDDGDPGQDDPYYIPDAGEHTCGDERHEFVASRPNVVLVLDKSGSMFESRWNHDGVADTADVTRWSSLHGVVERVAGDFEPGLDLGAVLFPAADAGNDLGGACLVSEEPDVAVGPFQAGAILEAIPAADAGGIYGGTPAREAIETAAAHLATQDPMRPRAIVLVTDGAANCSEGAGWPELAEVYDEGLVEAVARAREDHGVVTYVVGIDIIDALTGVGDDGAPEINAWEALNAVALAGGAPLAGEERFYNAVDEADLEMALSEIAGTVGSCELPLSSTPPAGILVSIEGEAVSEVGDCATGDGFVVEGDVVRLCGTACADFHAAGAVETVFECAPEP